ncbi:tetratricopeptide repeat protein [Schaalia sp. 19OD2882]|uniref:tetratricopeptide repeat protein n=1 Tax=Schaalia sp. 19OD2882 TaxID=2794089 RepID=UPI001C1ED7AD|nr:tetratricopeptide repeat protein [Schaalia sp. 19OD2882]QWW18896.1 tetratricopeptide repeat protein [Schaalia sp. 19OD2882]
MRPTDRAEASSDKTPHECEVVPDEEVPEDESEAFYEGRSERDDDLLGDRAARRRAERAAQSLGAPAKILTRGMKVALVVAVLVGMGGAIWWSSWTANSQDPHANLEDEMSGTNATEGTAVRIARAEAALEANPQNIDALLEVGALRFDMGDIDRAKEYFQKVIDVAPSDVRGWYHIGFCHLMAEPQDAEAAFGAWQKVIELDPESAQAKQAQMHMEHLQGPQSGHGSDSGGVPEGLGPPSGDGGRS